MPAMLPEVWLHWDPKTVQQRGAAALLGLRMDFLLLLPGHRIILEVDGVTHYTDAKGRPSPAAYASNAASDRERKLRGYEVFRFGGAELQTSDQARPMLTAFFSCLFDRFGTEV